MPYAKLELVVLFRLEHNFGLERMLSILVSNAFHLLGLPLWIRERACEENGRYGSRLVVSDGKWRFGRHCKVRCAVIVRIPRPGS